MTRLSIPHRAASLGHPAVKPTPVRTSIQSAKVDAIGGGKALTVILKATTPGVALE